MQVEILTFKSSYLKGALNVWNEVVLEGKAFPQTEVLNEKTGYDFFMAQSFTGVAVEKTTNEVVGVYILHPNNVGRCSHICNASYAVKSEVRGNRIGKMLVTDCIEKARELSFRILQFNAVVASNKRALALYESLGFIRLGIIPGGFLNKDNVYEDIIPHYLIL